MRSEVISQRQERWQHQGRSGLEEALDRLERARSADRAMNVAKCYQEVDRARAAIGE